MGVGQGMDPEEFVELVTRLREQPRENEWLEFKSNLDDPEEIGQYVSALSNAAAVDGQHRAYMVWGVEDGTRSLIGTKVDLLSHKKGNEDFFPWLIRSISPHVEHRYQAGEVDGHRVAVLEISAASHTPVQFRGVEYIRVGSYKKPLREFPALAKQLWRSLDETPFEHRVAIDSLRAEDALAKLQFDPYFELQGLPVPSHPQQVLDALSSDRLVVEQSSGRYGITNMGALLFAKRLVDFPGLERKAARVIKYKGNSKVNAEREAVGQIGYASGFLGLMEYIDNLLPMNEIIGDALRKTVTMYPPTAIRELVANALIHQDFSVTGSGPLIELYDDRMEITNPGTPLVEPNRFIDAPPRSRNEKLAAIMRRCNICEERGSGWDRIGFEIEFHQLPAPLVRVAANHTSVTLFSHRPLTKMDKSDRVRAVYLHACLRYVTGERVVNSSVRARFGLTEKEATTASSYIREALAAGMILPYDPDAGKKHMQYVPHWAKHDGDAF